MKKALLLASGGLDSTTLAYWLVWENMHVIPVFFDYGQHCSETEWGILNSILPDEKCEDPRRVDISDVFSESRSRLINEADLWSEKINHDDLYIPYRTLLFFFTRSCDCANVVNNYGL